jgi:LEA14-like dessication related protein
MSDLERRAKCGSGFSRDIGLECGSGFSRDLRLVGCVAILGCLVGVGCTGVPLGADPAEVELVNLTVLESTADKQKFALTFLISNPNAEPIPVQEIRYSVRLAGQGYLNGRSPANTTLAGSGRQTLRVDLETDGVVSPARLSSFAQGPDNALPYELSGDLVIGGQPPRALPFAASGDVPFSFSRGD